MGLHHHSTSGSYWHFCLIVFYFIWIQALEYIYFSISIMLRFYHCPWFIPRMKAPLFADPHEYSFCQRQSFKGAVHQGGQRGASCPQGGSSPEVPYGWTSISLCEVLKTCSPDIYREFEQRAWAKSQKQWNGGYPSAAYVPQRSKRFQLDEMI